MNIQKFTQKSMEAVQNAQNLTIENGNQQIEQAHLFASLLKNPGKSQPVADPVAIPLPGRLPGKSP